METGFISLSLYGFIVSKKPGNEEMALYDGYCQVKIKYEFPKPFPCDCRN